MKDKGAELKAELATLKEIIDWMSEESGSVLKKRKAPSIPKDDKKEPEAE